MNIKYKSSLILSFLCMAGVCLDAGFLDDLKNVVEKANAIDVAASPSEEKTASVDEQADHDTSASEGKTSTQIENDERVEEASSEQAGAAEAQSNGASLIDYGSAYKNIKFGDSLTTVDDKLIKIFNAKPDSFNRTFVSRNPGSKKGVYSLDSFIPYKFRLPDYNLLGYNHTNPENENERYANYINDFFRDYTSVLAYPSGPGKYNENLKITSIFLDSKQSSRPSQHGLCMFVVQYELDGDLKIGDIVKAFLRKYPDSSKETAAKLVPNSKYPGIFMEYQKITYSYFGDTIVATLREPSLGFKFVARDYEELSVDQKSHWIREAQRNGVRREPVALYQSIRDYFEKVQAELDDGVSSLKREFSSFGWKPDQNRYDHEALFDVVGPPTITTYSKAMLDEFSLSMDEFITNRIQSDQASENGSLESALEL